MIIKNQTNKIQKKNIGFIALISVIIISFVYHLPDFTVGLIFWIQNLNRPATNSQMHA